MNELVDLKELSKYAGERFDLVQAGGGNSSVKLDNGEMLIKASGFSLSDVNENQGYSRVKTKEIATIVQEKTVREEEDKRKRETITSELIKKAIVDKKNRPSIETILHSLLHKYTLHTHPIVVNAIVIEKNWKELLSLIFKDEEIVLVGYETPGIDLALELDLQLSKFDTIPNIIFLQNHGLIITSNIKSEVFKKTEYVLNKIEKYLKLDFNKYKLTNKISYLIKSASTNKSSNNISYLSEDLIINNQLKKDKSIFKQLPFCPDSLVYCGITASIIKSVSDINSIKKHMEKHFELPKIIILGNTLFINSINIKKAKEIEEVLKFNVLVRSNSGKKINYLENKELGYLNNWEAEKFRQKL